MVLLEGNAQNYTDDAEEEQDHEPLQVPGRVVALERGGVLPPLIA
jgi:hypothetical protein